ncbi:MAG: CDP-diacylglycerol--serine O-phosphatidyltransferase [Nitrospinae bacterium]|nr:CDP-diacylglycerol--serine O-phosphatidyltransferase [Nitrospinota bacterium]
MSDEPTSDENGAAPGEEIPAADAALQVEREAHRLGVVRRKGIYIVPSLITSAAFCAGFYAIIASINGQFYYAAWAIIVAMFFDGMDGRVARLTGATSHFGVELDSLSDLMSFGAAPAILMYNWVLQPYGAVGWMAAFLFTLCGALRLARFNTQVGEVKNNRFKGLPIPPSAGLLATIVLLTRGALEVDRAPAIVIVALVYVLAILMVSSVPYRSFKNLNLSHKRPFHILIGVILVAFVIVQFPHITLFAMAVTYAAHGPIEWYLDNRRLPLTEQARSFIGLPKDA